jgi:hypothetical protein
LDETERRLNALREMGLASPGFASVGVPDTWTQLWNKDQGTIWQISSLGLELLKDDRFEERVADLRHKFAHPGETALQFERVTAYQNKIVRQTERSMTRAVKRGVPESLAYLYGCSRHPPIMVHARGISREWPSKAQYLRTIKAARKQARTRRLPADPSEFPSFRDACLGFLRSYSSIAEAHGDDYMTTWVDKAIRGYGDLETDEAQSG